MDKSFLAWKVPYGTFIPVDEYKHWSDTTHYFGIAKKRKHWYYIDFNKDDLTKQVSLSSGDQCYIMQLLVGYWKEYSEAFEARK